MIGFLKRHWILISVLAISAIAHSFNMFHYPSYFDDEGTYMSQAWSLIKFGQLAPYTYWYDHAPVGWIIIAGWVKLTGGFFTFGTSVNSGRVLMLVLHLVSTGLLYQIVIKITNKKTPAVIAALLFSLSPLGITLQRIVFLDNIMVTFALLSLYLLVGSKRLSSVYFSAIVFGLAMLIKETALFLIPVYLLVLFFQAKKNNRSFSVLGWLIIMGMVVSLYPLYAVLKHELFSTGQFYFPDRPHVSLLETLKWQATRKGGYFLDPASEFMYTLKNSWLKTDFVLILVGSLAILINLVAGFWRKLYLCAALLGLSYIAYLIRGGIINDQYMIPMIPILALNVALLSDLLIDFLAKWKFSRSLRLAPAIVLMIGMIIVYSFNRDIYGYDATSGQLAAINWVKANQKPGDLIESDGYALVDLFPQNANSIYTKDGVHHYWKIDQDTKLRDELLEDKWWDVDYVLSTGRLERDASLGQLPLTKSILLNSRPIETYASKPSLNNSSLAGNILIGSAGAVKIYQRDSFEQIALNLSWKNYKNNFIHSYGQVIDPQTKSTTSEGQSYAMLRAVWMNDKPAFDGVWSWTMDHMQYRTQDKLFSWRWADDGSGKYVQTDTEPASDADVDIATALVLASEKFNNPVYLNQAIPVIQSIWEQEVVEIKKTYVLTANVGSLTPDGFLVNPSYFSPASYRLFAKVDPDPTHDWLKLADDTYTLLNRIHSVQYLPPNWIIIGQSTGKIKSAAKYRGAESDDYGYDAFRVAWRLGLDAKWFGTPQANDYLKLLSGVYINEWNYYKSFSAIYNGNAQRLVPYEGVSTSAAAIISLSVTDPAVAQQAYDKVYTSRFDFNAGSWRDGQNYYDQNWAWFATAFMNDEVMKSKYFYP